MSGLKGKVVGVAADRQSEAICTLLQKKGAEAVAYPSQGKQQLNQDISAQNVRDYIQLEFDWVILTTGIGAKTLEDASIEQGLEQHFTQKLQKESLVIRGSKTLRWLQEKELQPALVSEDGTMENLVAALPRGEETSRVFLQAYHQDDALWQETLEGLGYDVYVSKPYAFDPPEQSVTDRLRESIIAQSLDAVVFTSKTQVLNVFAEQNHEMVQSFNNGVIAVAVGKVTAGQLQEQGITYVVEPEVQKMGAMVVELERYYRTSQAQRLEVTSGVIKGNE